MGLFQDIFSEILAFPTIYCGTSRQDNTYRTVPLHYSTICKWELRNVDRRFAMNLPNIFYKLKKIQIKQIKDKVSLAMRTCKTNAKRITVEQVLSPGCIDGDATVCMMNDLECYENFEVPHHTGRVQKMMFLQ